MVLGLYYITKPRKGVKGEGLKFYSPEEVIIAFNERAVDLHAEIEVRLITWTRTVNRSDI